MPRLRNSSPSWYARSDAPMVVVMPTRSQPPARLMRRAVEMDGRGLHQQNSRLLAVHTSSARGSRFDSCRLSTFIDDSVRPVIHIRASANTYVPNAVPQAKYSSRLI